MTRFGSCAVCEAPDGCDFLQPEINSKLVSKAIKVSFEKVLIIWQEF
jgi:hypothetical protein